MNKKICRVSLQSDEVGGNNRLPSGRLKGMN